jgi:hypothetical protein
LSGHDGGVILVAGGELDFNLRALLDRMRRRRVAFAEVLFGPQRAPRLTVDLDRDRLSLNGKRLAPSACFMRHDVFMAQALRTAEAGAAALNWFAAIKGWELAHDDVRGFNKKAVTAESSKLGNLALARRHGLRVPRTLLTNDFALTRRTLRGAAIVKPAAGGDYTAELDAFRRDVARRAPVGYFPRFVQNKLLRPELRVYRIGDALFGFALTSPDLDYRARNRSRLKVARVPAALAGKYVALCDDLGLDFAAADFMRDPDGGHCFLEVNSQPMFAAFDAVSGGRLCDAIVDHLRGPGAR